MGSNRVITGADLLSFYHTLEDAERNLADGLREFAAGIRQEARSGILKAQEARRGLGTAVDWLRGLVPARSRGRSR